MTIRTVRVLRVLIMLRTSRFVRAHTMRHAVTREAELAHAARDEQTWIRRPMRRVTGNAAFGLDGHVLVHKWTLLIDVTLYASSVGSRGQSRLF